MQKQSGDACIITKTQTIVHCRYMSKYEYGDGGWVSLSPATYLVNAETLEQLQLVEAEGIPLSPQCHYFDRPGQFMDFTLVFPEMPAHWRRFHLIEQEHGGGFQVRMIRRNQEGVYHIQVI
jgi:hypothetical protein